MTRIALRSGRDHIAESFGEASLGAPGPGNLAQAERSMNMNARIPTDKIDVAAIERAVHADA